MSWISRGWIFRWIFGWIFHMYRRIIVTLLWLWDLPGPPKTGMRLESSSAPWPHLDHWATPFGAKWSFRLWCAASQAKGKDTKAAGHPDGWHRHMSGTKLLVLPCSLVFFSILLYSFYPPQQLSKRFSDLHPFKIPFAGFSREGSKSTVRLHSEISGGRNDAVNWKPFSCRAVESQLAGQEVAARWILEWIWTSQAWSQDWWEKSPGNHRNSKETIGNHVQMVDVDAKLLTVLVPRWRLGRWWYLWSWLGKQSVSWRIIYYFCCWDFETPQTLFVTLSP